MKNPYCLVKFEDGVSKVARFDLIREVGTKKPYNPKSSHDLPTNPVEVKWQKSIVGSDINHDGYYAATVLAVRSSLDAILEEAKDMHIRLPPCPVISLPARSMLDEKNTSKLRKRPRAAQIEPVIKSSTPKVVQEKPNKVVDVICGDHDDEDANFPEEDKTKAKKRKVNKAARDPVTMERLAQVLNQSMKSNPIMKASAKKMIESKGSPLKAVSGAVVTFSPSKFEFLSPLKSPCQSTSPFIVTPKDAVKEVESVRTVNAKKKLFSEEVERRLNKSTEMKHSSHDDESTKDNSNVQCGVLNLRDNPPSVKSDSSDESGSSKSGSDGKEDDLESTLPVSPALIKDDPSSESEMSFNSSSDDDSVGKLLDDNKRLTTELNSSKKALAELERQMTLANNLRLKYKENVAKLESENDHLRKKLTSMESEVIKLRQRNEYLQDKLVETERKDSKSKTPSITLKEPSAEENSTKFDQETEVLIDDETTVVSKSKKPKSKEASSNKRETKKDHNMDMKGPAIEATCSKVLDHLSGKAVIIEDNKGRINIENGVIVQKKAFLKNLSDHKLDLKKIARNLTAMVWSRAERCERSLEGDQSNRFADAERKQPAEPEKVAAILGAIKAHMLHSGDTEGPSMTSSLIMCRKAIGVKFAQDSYNEKRNNQ